jgi:hypothetical protein
MRFFRLFTIFCLFIALFIGLLPTLISSSWGKELSQSLINHFIPGKVEVRSLNLQWGAGQRIQGVLIKDSEGQTVVEIEHLFSEISLWSILTKSFNFESTQIEGFKAVVVLLDHRWHNLEKAVGVSKEEPVSESIPASPLILSDLSLTLNLDANQVLKAKIKGFSEQDHVIGSFDIECVINHFQKQSLADLSKIKSSNLGLQAQIHHLPIRFIDEMTSFKNSRFKGVFKSFFGDHLSIQMSKKANPNSQLNFKAYSPLVHAEINGYLAKGFFQTYGPSVAHFDLTPQFVNLFAPRVAHVSTGIPIKILFHTLSIPLTFLRDTYAIDFQKIGFNTEVSISKSDIKLSRIGLLNMERMVASLDSPAGSSKILITVKGHADFHKRPIDINYLRSIEKPKDVSSFKFLKKLMKSTEL